MKDKTKKSRKFRGRFPLLKMAAIVLLIVLGAVFMILALKWPFTRGAIVNSLEQLSSSEVRVGRFQKSFFPHPGYVAQNVIFTRDRARNARPLARIEKITCRGSWLALLSFTHRITRMDLEGVQIYIPAHLPPPIRRHTEPKIATTVADLFANGAILEIAPKHAASKTVRFDFPELALGNLGRNKAINFRTLILNAGLIGDLRATGTVGPLTLGRIAETRISGRYRLRHHDLSTYKVVAGTLSADGRFDGTLGRAEVAGRTEIPNFEVTRSRHSFGLTAEYQASVDGINGNVTIRSAQAHFLHSTLIAFGRIEGERGKTLSLDVDGSHARVEDLLCLFVKANRPPMDGALTLHARVVLPPEHEPFLKKVQLEGDFTIDRAEFTNHSTEGKVDELSARALGGKKATTTGGSETVPAELKSAVKLYGGIATLSEALFAVPGAVARGTGTYDLLNEAIDLHGKLAMHATLSKAAGGVKSLVLLPLDPFFKKNGAGAVLPVRITGTYSHPVFKVSLTKHY